MTSRKSRLRTGPVSLTDEDRRATIVRLLAEAYCIRLRRLGQVREPVIKKAATLPADTRYEFLQ